jgi:multiple antibiotic resistance protein
LIAFLSILIVSVINYLILINMSWFYRVMGKTGAVVVSRLMSIFISALAVDFVVSGLQELISRDLTF